MQVVFYGVRGSTPAPGAEFARYGGNTACVHVKLSDGTQLILDSGTGIKKLGHVLAQTQDDIHLLLSHNHWDHIQGFPFFLPAFQPKRKIYITPGLTTPYEPEAILNQMSGSWFPITRNELLADIEIVQQDVDVESWQIGSATISRRKMNHPGGGSSYLIADNGTKLAYVTDNELFPPYRVETQFSEWQSFIQDADLLIHDAQYTDVDMPLKHGWGHSLIEQAVELSVSAGVKRCAFYSHDHTRTDDAIDALLEQIQVKMAERDNPSAPEIFAAYEGQVVVLK
ncbi:MBL fold metallo-hydrolase [Saccharobesus litoralis]|uniref:MBL fold metallo-hydrolase n=1 Tax=Saccharobesus litoralis TaxID=2172099 RepID=A0A2S0VS16_9ALTE|nr:MBL fold metallo-hydrolase [Saccharobesus litoralis]AWB66999.1 MBL fold metallo-hydrolase [Saccharobesus litoralis]